MWQLGAFCIIGDQNGPVLLSHRRDLDLWNLPGGGVEADETPWACRKQTSGAADPAQDQADDGARGKKRHAGNASGASGLKVLARQRAPRPRTPRPSHQPHSANAPACDAPAVQATPKPHNGLTQSWKPQSSRASTLGRTAQSEPRAWCSLTERMS
jgi:hypothetical protein